MPRTLSRSVRLLLSALALTLAALPAAAAPAPRTTGAPRAAAAVPPAPAPARAKDTPGVFVLGIDGMDPVVLQRLMDAGKMPNFSRLAAEGSFQELGTSNPPQSPVAWSNFVTGMNPGGHGIYDFIHRDPLTHGAISSAVQPSHEEPTSLELFGYTLPLWGGGDSSNNRSGKPFWDYLHEAGVKTEVYRVPGNYPPTPSDALTLAGMGTVDMRGTAGEYMWYTDDLLVGAEDLKADVMIVTPEDEDGDGFEETVRSSLRGPPDSMRIAPVDQYVMTPLVVHIGPDQDVAWIRVGGQDAILQVGEWSDWIEVSFEVMPMMSMTGIVRFYLKELSPHFKLYASPVNIDPSAPAQPVTTPDDDAATALHEELGHYYTQGMPEEVNALKDRLFDEDDFVKQVQLVHEDGHAMLDLAMQRFSPGAMTFMYMSDIDLQCHMLWHHGDPKDPAAAPHPAKRADDEPRHAEHIERFYRGTDAVLGRVREQLPQDTLLIVMSDHGFQSYTRKLHLNAWLRDQGYLVLLPEKQGDGAPVTGGADAPRRTTGTAADVDWSRTRAYGVGFNSLYLNLEGREKDGIVPPAEAQALADEIIAKLVALTDPKTGQHPVRRADRAAQVYSGSRVAEAPDIVVGYEAGYGCSDRSTLGEVPAQVLEDNVGGEFTGNHLMAPEVVPGVLLLNRPLGSAGHDLTDVTASLLDYYGLPVPDDMVGSSFLRSP